MTARPSLIDHAFAIARVDLSPRHRPPSIAMVGAATVLAIVGSLIADFALAHLGAALFSSTKGYSHFRFSDYAKLTVIGVVIAAAAWPVVARVSAAPRWLFVRLAYLVSAVLLLPDVWLLWKGQPARAVGVLVAMHIAIGVITYTALVRIAPVRDDVP